MRRVFGPRTVVEAGFLVAVPVVAAVIGSGTWTIVVSSAIAYTVVFALEATVLRRRRRRPAAPAPSASLEVGEPGSGLFGSALPEHVRVLAPGEPPTAPGARHLAETSLGPEAAQPDRPSLAAVAEPMELEPSGSAAQGERVDHLSQLVADVVPIGFGSTPRSWNLWDLERLSREHSGSNPFRDEERTFLLMYLRDFARPDGVLPVDFDALVRDSFGDLVAAR